MVIVGYLIVIISRVNFSMVKRAWSSGRITGSPSTRSWVQSPLEVFRELNFSLHNVLLPARTLNGAGAVYGVTAHKWLHKGQD